MGWPFPLIHLICLLLALPGMARAQDAEPAHLAVPPAKLEQLIALALASHPSARAQRALEDSARAGVDGARWQYYPTPSISVERANASSSDPAYQGDSTVSILRLQQPLWTGGRLSAGVDRAEASAAVNQATGEEVRQQLALRVVQAYGDWLPAHLKTLANEKSLLTHIRLRDQVRRRVSEGISAEADFVLARARLDSLAAEIAVTRAQRDIALSRLGQLIGGPVDGAALSAAVATPRPLKSELPTLLDLALAANPAVRKAQAQARVQEAAMAERAADLSPEVFVRAERQFGNYSFRDAPPENRFFIGLSSRFGAGLSSFSNVEAARGQYQAALAEVDAQGRAISEQVLADYALVAASEERLAALGASLAASENVSASYDRQFLAGRKTWIEVMNAARELAQIEVQLADAQAAQVVATWRMAINTQGYLSVIGGSP